MSTTKVTDSVRDTTAVDAAKITTGTIPEARITTLDATKLTGNIADARIPASAVTQHVTATDLTPIRQDLAMLALYNAVSDNRAAYNLPSSFIDQFEDDTGLTTQTSVDRDATGEYVASVSISGYSATKYAVTSGMMSHLNMSSWNAAQVVDGATTGNTGFYLAAGNSSGYVQVDLGAANDQAFSKIRVYVNDATNAGVWTIAYSDDGSSWTNTDLTNFAPGAGSYNAWFEGTWTYVGGHRYWKMFVSAGNGAGQGWYTEIEWYTSGQTTNATGTLISDTQTASSATTKMSGVILYKDNAGTATLGTDLVVSLSANGGTNYTEAASYGTVTPLFSTGVKMVRLGETTVTSGTAPVIKAVWANQVASSSAAYVTGDRSSTITVTTNMTLGAGTVPTLVDGTFATLAADAFYWNNHTPSAGAYIQFAFSTATVCSEAKWYQDVVATTHGTWQWQGSNTAGGASGYSNIGSTFTLGGGGTAPWPFTTLTQLNSNTTAYLYYRLAWQSGAVSIGSWNGEVEFKQGVDVTGKETQLHGWAMNY